MLILGIDPGVNNIGVAVLNTTNSRIKKHECVSWKNKYVTVLDYFTNILTKYKFDAISIEKPFFTQITLAKNIKTLEIIGIIKMLCELENISVFEYSPATIKKSFTGNGKATKEDIMKEVTLKFEISEIDNHSADAIAIAYTHYVTTNLPNK